MKIVKILFYAVSVPILLYEYFVLFWFWGGDGVFTLVSTPIAFIAYLMGVKYLKRKIILKNTLIFKISAAISLPVLTMLTVWLIAWFLKIDIVIM